MLVYVCIMSLRNEVKDVSLKKEEFKRILIDTLTFILKPEKMNCIFYGRQIKVRRHVP